MTAPRPVVLRSDDPRRNRLVGAGWTLAARSWGARLDLGGIDVDRLRALVSRADASGTVRPLVRRDVAAVLALDAATRYDYPGREATAHVPLTAATAAVGGGRRAVGCVTPDGRLLAMTYVDVAGASAEVEFTVVAADVRGRGLSTAVKAASVLDLARTGVRTMRTGGSADNPAILAANRALGFVVDEEWLTLDPP